MKQKKNQKHHNSVYKPVQVINIDLTAGTGTESRLNIVTKGHSNSVSF